MGDQMRSLTLERIRWLKPSFVQNVNRPNSENNSTGRIFIYQALADRQMELLRTSYTVSSAYLSSYYSPHSSRLNSHIAVKISV